MNSTKLSVNLNKIALIRNSREGNYPDVARFGQICLDAGADGLTVHPRPDQRHIRPDDVFALNQLVQQHPGIEFNIEGNPNAEAIGAYPGFMALVRQTRPHQCTLVPDSNDQLTSDHGFDLTRSGDALRPIIEELHELGCRVSLFMDPDPAQIDLARTIGADRIELYTGPYAAAHKAHNSELHTLLEQYRAATEHARHIGLGVNAGHDLNLDNLGQFLHIPGIDEVSIGHALTVDALTMGMATAVHAYLRLCHHR
ncbi:pyridoxine 5'-phosphate synthase [Marinimicrobium sp. C6131]|uniref:pyridoxine 5'-phosphate synthase n=1 Tax=Marinimicrobium sp. C6131 TaxID=3022676 RepID=UPI00223D3C88|nr:pyridoxine 5'-phosphate synthase [Marinimicrobium sp. C6131]UZJ45619.1 pyridoxine 5'-phosphate synthase [Marinimicrobium sp. C6131]